MGLEERDPRGKMIFHTGHPFVFIITMTYTPTIYLGDLAEVASSRLSHCTDILYFLMYLSERSISASSSPKEGVVVVHPVEDPVSTHPMENSSIR